MPGFDRTGPMGAGAMTGGGRGRCHAGAGTAVGPYAGGYGRGRGFGRGYRCPTGYGQGFRRGPDWGFTPARTMTPGDELAHLKAQAAHLEKSLQTVNQRIDALQQSQD
jgi:hypothetical protein